MLTKDTIYGNDLGNHNFLHYINFLSQKTRDMFGSCTFSIQGLLMHSNWHRKADSNEGTARSHRNCISCQCRSWRDDGVTLEIGPALLRLLSGCSTEPGTDWLSLSEQQVLLWLEKEPSIFWKVLFLLFYELCGVLPAGAVQAEKFLLFFFCLNRVGIKVDSNWINLQNSQIRVKLTTWQSTGYSYSYSRSHGMLMEVRLFILTIWDKIQHTSFAASFKLIPELPETS